MAKIVVLIPTSGRKWLLRRTLQSLAACHFPPQYSGTFVVENGCKAGVEELVQDFSHIQCQYRYLAEANKSKAMNAVLTELSDSELVVFFDDDVRLSPDVLIKYASAFAKWGSAFFYGGPVGVDYEKAPAIELLPLLPVSAKGWENHTDDTLTPYDFLGCNWAIAHRHIAALGFFNPSFGPVSTALASGDEHDMMLRLTEAKIFPKYVAEAKVWHYVPEKRATLSWALRRKYKTGIFAGMNQPEEWPLIRLVGEASKALAGLGKGLLLFDKVRIAQHVFYLNFLRGIARGIMYGKKAVNT